MPTKPQPNIHDTALDDVRGSIARWEADRASNPVWRELRKAGMIIDANDSQTDSTRTDDGWEITATDFDIRIVGDGCDVAVKRGDTVTVAVVDDEAGMPRWQVTSIMETRGGRNYIPVPVRVPLWRRLLRWLKGIK